MSTEEKLTEFKEQVLKRMGEVHIEALSGQSKTERVFDEADAVHSCAMLLVESDSSQWPEACEAVLKFLQPYSAFSGERFTPIIERAYSRLRALSEMEEAQTLIREKAARSLLRFASERARLAAVAADVKRNEAWGDNIARDFPQRERNLAINERAAKALEALAAHKALEALAAHKALEALAAHKAPTPSPPKVRWPWSAPQDRGKLDEMWSDILRRCPDATATHEYVDGEYRINSIVEGMWTAQYGMRGFNALEHFLTMLEENGR